MVKIVFMPDKRICRKRPKDNQSGRFSVRARVQKAHARWWEDSLCQPQQDAECCGGGLWQGKLKAIYATQDRC